MIEENAGKYRVKTRARDFTHLLANLAEVSSDRAKGRARLTSARFCQQIREILSPFVDAASTSFLLDGGSLPPAFASRV